MTTSPNRFKKVRKALAGRKLLRFEYADSKGNVTDREVEPLGCYFLNKHCYVVAWDRARNGERVFRLDRMGHIAVNTSQPTVPDFDERPFAVQDWIRLPFQIGNEPFTAQVLFDAQNAWRAASLSMGQGTFEETEDGLLWTVEACDRLALAQWCIEHGPGIEPAYLTPASPQYIALLKAAIANHGEDPEEVAQ
jgi:predicted DNA-binding transcriptional regulator YafY